MGLRSSKSYMSTQTVTSVSTSIIHHSADSRLSVVELFSKHITEGDLLHLELPELPTRNKDAVTPALLKVWMLSDMALHATSHRQSVRRLLP